MSPLTRNVFDEIGKTNSISIHIRRADYLDKNTNEKHGCCSMDYYRQAINYMSKMVEKPTFFIFSDDIEFSKHALKSPFQVRFVDHNGPEKNYEDLILMSNCSHNIIANSTFSWWAAWLNRNPDKIVIAPSRWFTDSRLNSNNIIPDKWLKL